MNKPVVLGIIQARMGSSRLPGKVLAQIDAMSMLEILVKRMTKCVFLDSLIVATTTRKEDNKIVSICNKLNLKYYRGPNENVLSRFVEVLKHHTTDIVVRITADNPLTDPALVDRLVSEHIAHGADYTVSTGFPIGMGAEVVNACILEKINSFVTHPSHKEHVTLYIVNNPSDFKIHLVRAESPSHARVTVDTPQDLHDIRKLVSHKGNPIDISIKDVVDFWDAKHR
jgi:spore coat polysaccharide biosynthesis protein SpsF